MRPSEQVQRRNAPGGRGQRASSRRDSMGTPGKECLPPRLEGVRALPSRLVERFRSQGPYQHAVTWGIGCGALFGIGALGRGIAQGLATGVAVGLTVGLTTFAFRYRRTDASSSTAESAGIPWLRTLLFSLGFSGLIGAAALVLGAVKTERMTVIAEGIPAVAPLMLASAAAVFVVLVTTFWWQDRSS